MHGGSTTGVCVHPGCTTHAPAPTRPVSSADQTTALFLVLPLFEAPASEPLALAPTQLQQDDALAPTQLSQSTNPDSNPLDAAAQSGDEDAVLSSSEVAASTSEPHFQVLTWKDAEATRMVPPGKIVHVYPVRGVFKAALIDHHYDGTVRVFDRNLHPRMTLVPSLEASKRVPNGIPLPLPLGWSLLLPVGTVNFVQALKASGDLNSAKTLWMIIHCIA
jgi:hypothetical protein